MSTRYPYFTKVIEEVGDYSSNWGNYTVSPPFYEDTEVFFGATSGLRTIRTNNSNSQITLNSAYSPKRDISGCTHIILEYFVRPYPATTNTAAVNQRLWNTVKVVMGNAGLTAYRNWSRSSGYNADGYNYACGQPGYHRIVWPIGNYELTSSFDATQVEKVRIDWRAYDATPTATNADIDFTLLRIAAVTLVDQPRIFLTHDDCLYSTDGGSTSNGAYAYAQAAAELGLPVTFYCITGKVGTTVSDNVYCTKSQLEEMRDMGHVIASHGADHSSFFDADGDTSYDFVNVQSEGRLKYVCRTARDWLLDNGFARGAYLHATPYTHYSYDAMRWLTEGPDPIAYQVAIGVGAHSGFAQVIDTDGTPADSWLDDKNWPWYLDPQFPNRVNWDTAAMPNSKTMTDTVAQVVANQCSIAGYLHNYNSNVQAHLEAVAAGVSAGTIRAATMDELLGLGAGTMVHGGGGGSMGIGI